MEDRCLICGLDVSDMSTQVCPNCLNKEGKTMAMSQRQSKYLRKERECRMYRDWLNRRPHRWRIISYLKWLGEEPKRK